MHSVRSLQHPTATLGKQFTRQSGLTASQGKLRQNGIIVPGPKSKHSLSFFSTQCRHWTPLGIRKDVTTNVLTPLPRPTSSAAVKAIPSARTFTTIFTKNITPHWSRSLPLLSRLSSSLSDQGTTTTTTTSTDVSGASVQPSSSTTPSPLSPLPLSSVSSPSSSDLMDEKKMASNSDSSTSQHWSEQQDELLQELFDRHGRNWKLIQSLMMERYGQECQSRTEADFRNRMEELKRKFNHGSWSKREEWTLLKGIAEIEAEYEARGENLRKIYDTDAKKSIDQDEKKNQGRSLFVRSFWKSVAKKVESRTESQCRNRFHEIMNGRKIRVPWTIEELLMLRDLQIGRRSGWDCDDDDTRNSNSVQDSNNSKLTDEEWSKLDLSLKETRTKGAIATKLKDIETHARAISKSPREYFERLVEKKKAKTISKTTVDRSTVDRSKKIDW